MDDQTVSVSKGVFVFKNNFKNLKQKKRKSVEKGTRSNIFSDTLWYQCYYELWERIEETIEDLNNEMFSSVLSDLITFIGGSYDSTVDEIPTAALLTGINMPDHEAQFKALSKQIKKSVSPHVACLHSQDCQNLKYLMENMISQFMNDGESLLSTDEELEMGESTKHIKKKLLNLSVLQCWYENLYRDDVFNSPKKQMAKVKKKVLVVIIPDFESFTAPVLQKFILIVNWYIKTLPFVFIFGIATSISTLHMTLPYQVSSKISVHVFNSQPSTDYLNTILEEVFFSLDCPFQLGGKVFNLFTDIFLFYDFSVSNFIHNIKYAMAEHFSYGNAMTLCNSHPKKIKQVLNNFTHDDCENVRQIMSFRKLVENEQDCTIRIKLLTDDEYFKPVLEEEINTVKKYVRRLHIFLKCLHIMVKDLPKSPLGKQLRELYSFALSANVTNTPEYRECFQLLGFQSKEELSAKLSKILDYISSIIKDTNKPNKLRDFMNELSSYLNNMNNFDETASEEDLIESEQDSLVVGQMDRKQLKEKLLEMTKKQNKPMNKYEKVRNSVLKFLSDNFKQHLVEPTSLYFHEIFFFNNISIQNYIVGTHRSATHNALNDPQYYLQCNCCHIPNSSAIRPSMPDICITYKLHLECGKMINLYDWLQAFLSIVDPVDVDDDSKRAVDPEVQARFTQAVAELEFLGFIKSSKRKADHVTRLTWGG